MPSIVPMMSAIFLLLVWIWSIVVTTWVTTSPPLRATLAAELASWLAVLALSALWRTVPVSCSIELAVCCRLDAVCSVRLDRSALPEATSTLATWIVSAAPRTWPTSACRRCCIAARARSRSAVSSRPLASMRCDRSPSAMAPAARCASPSGRQIEIMFTSVSGTTTTSDSARAASSTLRAIVAAASLCALTSVASALIRVLNFSMWASAPRICALARASSSLLAAAALS
jgi:hypothetical protein